MRYLYILIFFSVFGYSQSNEGLINQAVNEAKEQNITNKSEATKALEARGLSENQVRQLARQRGLSYDQLLNEYLNQSNSSETSPENISLESEEVPLEENLTNDEENDDITYRIKGETNNYFGYDIFRNNPFLNKEYLTGNIDEGYLIAPGDEIRIIIYGDNSLEVIVKVDKNGNINIKNYGLFLASGMTFKTLKSRLKVFLGRYLSGLVSTPQKTFMDVSLTQLKPTKIVVLGQVTSPGPHILTTSGSALSALYAAGGVKTSGSLRDIIIYRNNKLLKRIDIYDYITNGKLKDDIRLTNNDIVFVPNRKNSIEVKGELSKSAIYEVKENEDLTTLVEYSGGLLPTTQTSKVNIQRIIPASERKLEDYIDRELITINYQKLLKENEKIDLYDGDQITFFRILDLQSDQVTISGHVYEPGTFSIKSFPTLKSLIIDASKGLMPNVYLEKVDVYSIVDGIEVLNSYNLNDIMEESSNVNLTDGDRVIVYDNLKVEGDKSISISGFGTKDVVIDWKENFSLYDIIFNYTQIENPEFTDNLLKSRIDLKRYNPNTGNYYTTIYNFDKIKELKNALLKPKDEIKIYSSNTTKNNLEKVSIYGYVKKGNIFSLEDNMYVEDVILLAGGYADPADQTYVDVSRFEIDAAEERITRYFRVNIDKKYLLGKKDKPDNNFILKDKDIVLVPKVLGYDNIQNIQVIGEVNFPKNVILETKNSSFDYIIEKAGGLTKYANLKSSYLRRDGKIINIDLSNLNDKQQIFVDGDVIFIESSLGTVSTLGAIQNESTFIWEKGLRAKYYIRNSGGKIKKESDNSYVIFQNGITKKIGFLRNPKIPVNSQIIVNRKIQKEKKQRPPFMQGFNDTFALIASTLVSVLLAQRL